MLEIFFTIILLISLIGMGIMLYAKAPVLVKLEVKEKSSLKKNRREGILKFFSIDRFLHKILSKFRVLTLRTENRTSTLLTKLRQKSIKEKTKFSDDYWKKLKRRK